MFEADVLAEWSAPVVPSNAPVAVPGWMVPLEDEPAADEGPLVEAPQAPVAPPKEPSSPPPPPPPSRTWPRDSSRGSLRAPSQRSAQLPAPGPDPAELERLHAALIEAIAVGVRARREALLATERDLVYLALAIAGKVVGKEIVTDPSIIAGWAREGIAALGEKDQVTVSISPDLAARVPPQAWAEALDGLQPTVDHALAPGGCEVRGLYGRVDTGLASRLASVAEVLEDTLPGATGSEGG